MKPIVIAATALALLAAAPAEAASSRSAAERAVTRRAASYAGVSTSDVDTSCTRYRRQPARFHCDWSYANPDAAVCIVSGSATASYAYGYYAVRLFDVKTTYC